MATMKRKVSRRNFSRMAIFGLVFAPEILRGEREAPEQEIQQDMGRLSATLSEHRRREIRKAMRSMEAHAAAVRAWKLERDTQPALILGVFDAAGMFACEEDGRGR